jgi:hypothetical protein
MPPTLADLLETRDDPKIVICCGAPSCGRRLGQYVAYAPDDDQPQDIELAQPDPPTIGRSLGTRTGKGMKGRMTGARGFRMINRPKTTAGHVTYEWRCGCGAKPQRRDDRLGRLEVDTRVDPPRVYV